MMRIRYHATAEREMTDAASYYEAQRKDLGKQFLAAVRDALTGIQINPLLFPLVEGDVRRARTKNFPYGVLFRVMPDQLVIVAVMHLHRDPDYWKDRVHDAPSD
jgi:toxin ParE1/3/4